MLLGVVGLGFLVHFSLCLFGAVICLYLAKASDELGEKAKANEKKQQPNPFDTKTIDL